MEQNIRIYRGRFHLAGGGRVDHQIRRASHFFPRVDILQIQEILIYCLIAPDGVYIAHIRQDRLPTNLRHFVGIRKQGSGH